MDCGSVDDLTLLAAASLPALERHARQLTDDGRKKEVEKKERKKRSTQKNI